jgi:hypothetical protein
MIIATITALSILFGGGNLQGAFFEIPKVEKLIKENVEDKDRKKEAKAISKEYYKAVKKIRKEEKKKIKELKKTAAIRSTTKEELNELIDSISSIDQKGQQTWIKLRLDITKTLTKEEFDKIIVAGTTEDEKVEKQNLKAKQKRDKAIQNIRTSLKEGITDQAKIDKVLEDFQQYEDAVNDLFKMQQEINYELDETLKKYNASEEELQTLIENVRKYNDGVLKAFETFNFQLVEQTTDEEWKNINKKVIELIK